MAQDTTVILPQLTVILEGMGTINTWSILVNNVEVSSNLNPVPVNVLLNDEVVINVNIMNSDTNIAPDFIYGEFVSAEITPREELIQWSAAEVPVDSSIDVSWSFPMPSNNVTATINAGHHTTETIPIPLIVSDITTIDPINLGNTGSSVSQDIFFKVLDGTILFQRRTYSLESNDMGIVVPAQPLIIDIESSANVEGNGGIPIQYDGKSIISYLPLGTGPAIFYIAVDGSSYYDQALTQLARQAL